MPKRITRRKAAQTVDVWDGACVLSTRTDDLTKILTAYSSREMTRQQKEAQRRSFVYGNTKIANEAITRDMTTFTTDPTPIYARRTAVAGAIEQLTK